MISINHLPTNVSELQQAVRDGLTFKFQFFWGQTHAVKSKACFSQFYPAQFKSEDGTVFSCAEQYMMYYKALLFHNNSIAGRILRCEHAVSMKKLGREIVGFEDSVWRANREIIVRDGNLLKFGQNPELLGYLQRTRGKILVEASPVDPIWGIGLSENNPESEDPLKWQGQNLLGFILTSVRAYFDENAPVA